MAHTTTNASTKRKVRDVRLRQSTNDPPENFNVAKREIPEDRLQPLQSVFAIVARDSSGQILDTRVALRPATTQSGMEPGFSEMMPFIAVHRGTGTVLLHLRLKMLPSGGWSGSRVIGKRTPCRR